MKIGGGNADRTLLDALGLTFETLKIPSAIGARIGETGWRRAISDLRSPTAAKRGHARYIGVRLPAKKIRLFNGGPQGGTLRFPS